MSRSPDTVITVRRGKETPTDRNAIRKFYEKIELERQKLIDIYVELRMTGKTGSLVNVSYLERLIQLSQGLTHASINQEGILLQRMLRRVQAVRGH